METVLIPERKRLRSLRWSIWDGAFYASMVGFGETYFIPLLVAFGATNYQVGMFNSVPQLCLAFAQFGGIALVERLMVRKRVLVGAVLAQIIFLALMFYEVAAGKFSPWSFMLLAAGYFSVNGVIFPAWNSLIGDLTTNADRGRYLGRRNGLAQLITFLAVLSAGLILQKYHALGLNHAGFAIILFAAIASRIGSVVALVHHFEVPYRRAKDAYFSFWQFIKHSPKSNFAHFVFYISLINLAVQISSPYFAVYMLRDLHFSYIEYTIAQGTFIVSQFIAMRRWGPFCDRYGNRLTLLIVSIAMPILPVQWLLSTNLLYIVLIQTFGGFVWGGWYLSTANFIFDAVTPAKRARCAAYLNFFNSLGFFFGAATGAFLCTRMPAALHAGRTSFSLLSPLEFLFIISGVLRLVIILVFLPSIREVRDVSRPKAKDVFLMLMHVWPFSGAPHEPYTGINVREQNGNGNGNGNHN